MSASEPIASSSSNSSSSSNNKIDNDNKEENNNENDIDFNDNKNDNKNDNNNNNNNKNDNKNDIDNSTSLLLPPLLIRLRQQFADTKRTTKPESQKRDNSGVVTKCICDQAECKELQKTLQLTGDLWFGTTKLTYSITNPLAKRFSEHVLETLGLTKDRFPKDKDTRFKVARHHWTRPLIALHDEYSLFWTKPLLTDEDAAAYLYQVLPSSRIPGTNQGYFQTPNNPLHAVKEYLYQLAPDPAELARRTKAAADNARQNANRTPQEWQAILAVKDMELHKLQQDMLNLQTKINESTIRVENLQASNLKFKQERNEAVRDAKRQKVNPTKSPKGPRPGNAEQYPCTVQTFYDFICVSGGLSRMSLSNDDWHCKHPKGALHLFGYKTWLEAKLDLTARFPALVHDRPSMTRRKNGKLELDTPTEFEKCLCMKMYSRTKLSRQRLGMIWGVDDTTITRYKKTWGKIWEDLGFTLPEYTGLKPSKEDEHEGNIFML